MSSIGYRHAYRMAMDICIFVGRRIRELRQSKGWTQTYLSVYAGVGRNYISDVELGKKEIGLRNLHLMALSLEVPLEKLFKGM